MIVHICAQSGFILQGLVTALPGAHIQDLPVIFSCLGRRSAGILISLTSCPSWGEMHWILGSSGFLLMGVLGLLGGSLEDEAVTEDSPSSAIGSNWEYLGQRSWFCVSLPLQICLQSDPRILMWETLLGQQRSESLNNEKRLITNHAAQHAIKTSKYNSRELKGTKLTPTMRLYTWSSGRGVRSSLCRISWNCPAIPSLGGWVSRDIGIGLGQGCEVWFYTSWGLFFNKRKNGYNLCGYDLWWDRIRKEQKRSKWPTQPLLLRLPHLYRHVAGW